MNKINNYNKEEHIHFIETLIKTEQVEVFINNMDISEQSKTQQTDTIEYLYNRIIELQNNWNELKKWLQEGIEEQEKIWRQREIIYSFQNVLDEMKELEGNNERKIENV